MVGSFAIVELDLAALLDTSRDAPELAVRDPVAGPGIGVVEEPRGEIVGVVGERRARSR